MSWSKTVSGYVKLKLTVGAYSAVVDAQVFDLGDQYELLVGDDGWIQ